MDELFCQRCRKLLKDDLGCPCGGKTVNECYESALDETENAMDVLEASNLYQNSTRDDIGRTNAETPDDSLRLFSSLDTDYGFSARRVFQDTASPVEPFFDQPPENNDDNVQHRTSDVKSSNIEVTDRVEQGSTAKVDVVSVAGPSGVNIKQKKTGREKNFVCKCCKKRFHCLSHLTIHERIHTNEKPFDCKSCGKKFSSKANLKCHLRIHTEEKPFACEVCDRRFRYKGNLNRHIRTNAEEKTFVCNECGRQFAQKDCLRQHFWIHTKKKPHECHYCGRKFGYKSHLTAHLRTHTGEKPFECEICGKAFSAKNSRKRHFIVKHEAK